MNAITKPNNTGLSAEQHRAMLREKARALKARGDAPQKFDRGGVVFAKFNGNTGRFTAGRDEKDIDLEQRFVIPVEVIKKGYVRWEGGKVADRKLVPLLDFAPIQLPPDAVMVGDLPKPRHRDGWSEVGVLRATGMGGEYDKIEIELQLSSTGGMQAFNDLTSEIIDQCDEDPDGFFNAVIEVEAGSYENDTYGKTVYFPIFHILGWTDDTGQLRMLEESDEEDPLG